MANNGTQPGEPNPPPLNEEHMLEWVEGKLSRIEEASRAAAARPGVADRVRQMQANRRALRSLGEARAPAELMDRVLAAMERETLLGLTQGEDVEDHPPIPIAPHIEALPRRAAERRWVPGLALAAGLLLLVGGVGYWGSMLVKPVPAGGGAGGGGAGSGIGPVAVAKPDESARAGQPETGVSTMAAAADTARAEGTDRVSAPAVVAAASDPAADLAALQRADDAAVAMITAPLSEARVLQLAREGRLVMRVYARDTKNLGQIEAMDSLKGGRAWRVSKDVPLAVTAAVVPVDRPVGPPTGTEREPALAQMASLMGTGAAINWPVNPITVMPMARVRATYLVDFPDTSRGLASVKLTFKDKLRAGVVFEELPETVDLPKPADAEGMLWWTLPPSGWTQRVTVPVVVESR